MIKSHSDFHFIINQQQYNHLEASIPLKISPPSPCLILFSFYLLVIWQHPLYHACEKDNQFPQWQEVSLHNKSPQRTDSNHLV